MPFLDMRVLPQCFARACSCAPQGVPMKRFYPIVLLITLAWAASLKAQQNVTGPPSQPPDPLLDVPPMPEGTVSLIGGTVKSVDQVRDKLLVRVFGGKVLKMAFDERTHIYRDGAETTQLGIHKGDRVYVDTMLDGPWVFARNIRVETSAIVADSTGQVVSVNRHEGTVSLRDSVLAQTVIFQVDDKTSLRRDQQPVSLSELTPGSLVAVKFAPERTHRGVAREVVILAAPGMQFTFAGKVAYLDLRSGILSLANQADGKTYDLNFSPRRVDKLDALGVGSQVTVQATFERAGYRADSVTIIAPPEEPMR